MADFEAMTPRLCDPGTYAYVTQVGMHNNVHCGQTYDVGFHLTL